MSSTTSTRSERGQVLVLFAGGLIVLFIVAALAFDVGMTLQERHPHVKRQGRHDEQDDEAAGEQDEDLSPLGSGASC